MSPVHLRVVELKGDRQDVFEKFLSVASPDQKRIIENTAVHTDSAVYFRIDDRRRADHHTFAGKIPVPTGVGDLGGVCQIFPIERVQVVRKQNVAGTDLPVFVFDDRVYGDFVIAHQLVPDGKQIKFLYPDGGLSDAPVEKHIEFHLFSFAGFDQIRHIRCFKECYHRVRSPHPKHERCGSGRFFRIYFDCHCFLPIPLMLNRLFQCSPIIFSIHIILNHRPNL